MANGSSRRWPSCGSTPSSLQRPPATPRRGRAIDSSSALVGVPVRTCLGCRKRRASSQLVRVTRLERDDVPRLVVDGPSRGRGAWLCRDDVLGCLEAALQRCQFDRAWRMALADGDRAELRAVLRSFADRRVTDGVTDTQVTASVTPTMRDADGVAWE